MWSLRWRKMKSSWEKKNSGTRRHRIILQVLKRVRTPSASASLPLASRCPYSRSPSPWQVCQQKRFSSRGCSSPVCWRASGTCCCGKGGSPRGSLPHPLHEFVFCSVFLSHLLFLSAHKHLNPAPASRPRQPLSQSQPPSQMAKILMPSLHACIALAPHSYCLCESPHSVLGLWQCPVTAHMAKYHPLPTLAGSISASCHLVVLFETPMDLTCQDSAGILIACSNELRLAIIIADEHTLSAKALLSASSDGWI